uniref:Transmembrane protein 119 n=1 Tax=Cynoglossus semilaevis TaxID=244447 RepID=A0A3P8WBR5_CYNSE
MLPTAGAQIRALVLFLLSSGSVATPLPLYSSFEGSTDEDDYSVFPSSLPTIFLLTEYRTTPVGSTVVKTDLLSQVANFLEENMLLILVASSFFLLFFLIVCGAIFMSQRRKVNAYYPSSYPTKMYVDQRDKTGGAKVFDDVPEKAAPEQEREAVDSHRQLQDEIMKAARSLRTPTKPAAAAAEGKENSQMPPPPGERKTVKEQRSSVLKTRQRHLVAASWNSSSQVSLRRRRGSWVKTRPELQQR